jgi:transposase-like protein
LSTAVSSPPAGDRGARVCPGCQSRNVRRSHRKWGVERFLLPLVLLRPFRCKNCGRRYYGYMFSKRDRHHPVAFDEEPESMPLVAPEATKRRPKGAVAGMQCPQCQSWNVHRSRRRERWDRLNQLRLVRRFRCHDCNARIHAFVPGVWLRRLLAPTK